MSAVMMVVWAVALAAQAGEDTAMNTTGVWSVLDFGAVDDASGDNTEAFQAALDAARAADGGVVTVPAGRYRFEGAITVPSNVTLRGVFAYAPAHAGIRDGGHQERPEFGSVLEPYGGAGDEDAAPFITLQANATVQGFTVHYPAQDPKADAPTPYPWTIRMRGNNPAVMDMQLLNPYNAIDASENQRALIRNIHGQPIHIGVYVDRIYDIGRIENVHWNPWWSHKTPVFDWQMKHGIGFIFGRTDWHYVLNTFCFGYNVGYKFIETKDGATNGNFLGIGADDCHTALLAEQTAPMGVLITNGEFVSFNGPDPTMVRVEKTHSGTIRFSNCAFWGPSNRNVVVDGHGTVGFSDCTFMQWGHRRGDRKQQTDTPSIEALGGSLLVRGCEFLEDKPQIRLGRGVERAIITENLIAGKTRIENKARGRAIIKNNAATPRGKFWREHHQSAPGFRSRSLRKAGK